jgi:hypothetical protein
VYRKSTPHRLMLNHCEPNVGAHVPTRTKFGPAPAKGRLENVYFSSAHASVNGESVCRLVRDEQAGSDRVIDMERVLDP